MDQQRMLEAARAGDQEAFRILVEPHLASAYRTAVLIVLDRELARDAVQEALLRACRSLGRFEPGRPFGAWLHRIVVNESRRMAGRRSAQPALLGELPMIPVDDDSPEDAVMRREERELLWEALSRLDELHRTVLILRYYQGLSEAEMADVLEIRPGTVKSRLHNARRLLQEELMAGARPCWHRKILYAIQRRLTNA